VINDTIFEGAENVVITLTGTANTLGTVAIDATPATVTIIDNNTVPTVTAIAPASAIEGSPVVFTFTIGNPSAVDTTYIFTLSNGTAGNDDYTTTNVVVLVPAGATTGTASVPTTVDTIDEPSETFTIATGTATATGTILDNNNAPQVLISSPIVVEGTDAVFTITLSSPSSVDTIIEIVTIPGTADTADYTPTRITVTIPAGATSATVIVPTTNDSISEPNENFSVTGTITSGNTSNTTISGTATITDNDPMPIVSISSPTIIEGLDAVLTITLSNPSSVDTIITIVTTSGTADSTDYTEVITVVTIPAGSTSTTVSVPTTNDTVSEPSETFTVTGTVTSGNTINTTTGAVVTIIDNDGAPIVTIGDAITVEGNTLYFPISLSNASAEDITITIGFTNVTTTNGDYTITPVTVTIVAGSTSATAIVTTTEDTIEETDETFIVAIISNTGSVGNISDTAIGTIIDNDKIPKISLVKEGVFNDNNGDGSAQVGETIIYTFTVGNRGTVALTNVNLVDVLPGLVLIGSPIAVLEVGSSNNTNYSATYTITQEDIIRTEVTNQAEVSGTSLNGEIVKDVSVKRIDFPIVLPACTVDVFNAVSPNEDGKNDVFYIKGLECYPDNSVEIYNRWGVLVFERDHYNNEERVFKGISEGRVTVKQAEQLPTGTYFYILKYKDESSKGFEKSGYLYLNR
jgi:gliding motility-associated-like protein